jgi:hypothetical protein
MNYARIYSQIIDRARASSRVKGDVYYEEHHIQPKCRGGDNNPENLVLLTAREHFLAHWLLVKMYNDFQLVYAFNCFCMETHKGDRPTSHLYKYARERYISMLKANTEWKRKMGLSMTKLIWIKKEDTLECLRILPEDFDSFAAVGYSKGRIIPHRKAHSSETIEKIRRAHTGKILSPEHIEKMRVEGLKRKWITDGRICKMVGDKDIDAYLQSGWKLGRYFNYQKHQRGRKKE